MKKLTIWLWIFAFVLTLVIAVYQRLTGPTHPVMGKEDLSGIQVKYRFLRSYSAFENMPVTIIMDHDNAEAFLSFKRYKTRDDWTEVKMTKKAKRFTAEIPGQPSAGKIEYSIRVNVENKNFILPKGKSIVARFRGKVPAVFLIVHIVFMFLGILFALRTGMESLRKNGNYYWMVNWTLIIVFIGGMIFGPIVQKYAFGDFWTGIPFGFDLTDNKTLLAVIFWLIAFFMKKKSKWWVLVATILMIVVYLIPHSVLGSELDYSTGKMKNKYSLNQVSPTILDYFKYDQV
jgi:hypothetical protein